MASEVDICNLGLAHLGNSATVASIDPVDGSVEADYCKRFYPLARDTLLEAHTWNFALYRSSLALLSNPPTPWAYRYALPSDCAKPWAVLPYQANDDQNSVDYIIEAIADGTRTILTNEESATLRYTRRITDTTKFSVMFVQVVARLLAAHVAGPLLKGKTGREEAINQYKLFMVERAEAMSSDSNSQKLHPDHTPSSLAAR